MKVRSILILFFISIISFFLNGTSIDYCEFRIDLASNGYSDIQFFLILDSSKDKNFYMLNFGCDDFLFYDKDNVLTYKKIDDKI
jgi:hypothetical protein